MKQKQARWIFAMASGLTASVAVLTSLVGCGSDNSGAPAPVAVVTPATQCQVGQVYNSQYGCLNQQSCQAGYGWVPQQGLCVPGTVTNPTTAGTKFYSSLQITNKGQLELALQTSRLCDPYLVGWNYGSLSCRNYSQAGYVVFQISSSNSNQAYIRIGAGSSSPNSPNTDWVTGGRVLEMAGNINLYAYNNNAGFIGSDPNATGGIRIVVANGLPASAVSFAAVLEYNGVEFARGTLSRY